MTESIASWITLAAVLSSIGWYIYRQTEYNINNIVTSVMSGILCLFGGLLFSGAIMKVVGKFDNALIPALLVCIGTALCVLAHTIYQNKKSASNRDTAEPL
ncbi:MULTISPECIES: hypothetical protein [unclassified Neptuniibacter]|jgi:hypothetical protein|uniref:hypothetical protein n=1 Tax=unclassified Neptuniibacter TaxID=2630693 RepID=UPI0026E42932|nr:MULTISPECIES: hypothetical protein [unclassified Neptuniibacter]MDO6512809.1 hypothetical protein [Neptuniibacter sp. 2_MG-2023]MDO6593007.1 hypothetical protein [Neptuniibacter sp. 1_MG-2023]